MRRCQACGAENEAGAVRCVACGAFLPPDNPAVVELSGRRSRRGGAWRAMLAYLLGLVVGAVPLALVLVSVAYTCPGYRGYYGCRLDARDPAFQHRVQTLGSAGLWLWAGFGVVSLILLFFPRLRLFGFGMLTMALASPVIYPIACVPLYGSAVR